MLKIPMHASSTQRRVFDSCATRATVIYTLHCEWTGVSMTQSLNVILRQSFKTRPRY